MSCVLTFVFPCRTPAHLPLADVKVIVYFSLSAFSCVFSGLNHHSSHTDLIIVIVKCLIIPPSHKLSLSLFAVPDCTFSHCQRFDCFSSCEFAFPNFFLHLHVISQVPSALNIFPMFLSSPRQIVCVSPVVSAIY